MTVTSCFVYEVIKDLESIYRLCINPIRRIELHVIHRLSIDSRKQKWSAEVNVSLNNGKQNITLLSLLVCTTVLSHLSQAGPLCILMDCIIHDILYFYL